MTHDFNGLRVAVLDTGMASLVTACHGHPVHAGDHDAYHAVSKALTDGMVDVILFTQPEQIRQFFHTAQMRSEIPQVRDALRQTVIGVTGPACTAALQAFFVTPDFEPDEPEPEPLVRGLARRSHQLVTKKGAAVDAGVDTIHWRRIDMRWPQAARPHDTLAASAFLRACRREPTDYTPVWLLRQAGRYQRAYREIRSRVDFLDMCKTPELTAEITLMAVERLGTDAAILFADLLPLLQPMGLHLEYVKDGGPVIHNPVRSGQAVDQLEEADPASQAFVYEAIRLTRRALPPDVPLIGFAGAPFTLASYAIEGGASKDFRHTKRLMYSDSGAWHALMEKLSRAAVGYLTRQIEAGVQAVQLFDSWVGCLCPDDYRVFVLPHMASIFSRLPPGVPAIHFGTDTGSLLAWMREAGGDVVGLDWRVDLAEAWARLNFEVAVQGNLDPIVLFAPPEEIRKRVKAILQKAGGRPGHIFNLGHGILPETPEDHVVALVDAVHEYSQKMKEPEEPADPLVL